MTTRRFSQSVARSGLVIALAALAGCGQTRTADEVRNEYARMLLDGGALGMTVVTARAIDPVTGDLLDVSLDDGARQIVAQRCEILVSSENDTISLRLHDVTAADPETGRLVTMKGFTTEPAKLPYKVVAGPNGL